MKRCIMNLANLITDFFSGLQTKKPELPPVSVVRDNQSTSIINPAIAKVQPRVERDLVRVGELPMLSPEEYKTVTAEEDAKDGVIDYRASLKDALKAEEGGSVNKGYIPMSKGQVIGQSGVTIGKGFDLGQFSYNDLKKIGVPETSLKRLSPYLGIKGTAAVKTLKQNPLKLADEEVQMLNDTIFGHKVNKLEKTIQSLESQAKNKLSPNQKVALGSMLYQGVTPQEFPNAFKAFVKGDMEAAKKAFLNSKWAKEQTPARAKRTIEALINDISLKDAEDKLSSLGEIATNHRIFS